VEWVINRPVSKCGCCEKQATDTLSTLDKLWMVSENMFAQLVGDFPSLIVDMRGSIKIMLVPAIMRAFPLCDVFH